MFIQFLVENISGQKLLKAIMEKFNAELPLFPIEYSILSYKGIGGLPKGSDTHNVKSQQLLTDLPKRLRAFQTKFQYLEQAAIFVVLDNDNRETKFFKEQLVDILQKEKISMDSVFCIAVEEMEAWLLGDRAAIQAAYPRVADRIASKHSAYKQDSICGTWEVLADMLTKGGFSQFKKKNPSAFDVGYTKSQWAEKIGEHLNIRNNQSPSFQYFIAELDKRRNTSMYTT